MKKLNQLFLLVALVLASSTVMAQTTLRYNLKVGETYGLKQTTSQDIEQSISGMSQTIKNTLGGDISIKITDKTGDIYTSEFVYKSLLFKMESAMMNMGYDSNDENADKTNPLYKTFNIIVGHVFEMKFDNRGNITEVNGFENVVEKLATAFEDNAQQGKMMKETLSGQFSDESMKHNLGSMFIIYPEEKVKEGSVWSSQTKVAQPVIINNDLNYNVESISKTVVELSATGKMQTEEGQSKEQMGMMQHFSLAGDMVFKASINPATGWPIEISLDQTIDGNVAIESPQLPAPMEVPMTIKSKTIYTSL